MIRWLFDDERNPTFLSDARVDSNENEQEKILVSFPAREARLIFKPGREATDASMPGIGGWNTAQPGLGGRKRQQKTLGGIQRDLTPAPRLGKCGKDTESPDHFTLSGQA